MPRAWLAAIRKKARARGADLFDQAAVYIKWLTKYGGARSADMNESDLRDRADLYARQGSQEDFYRIMRDNLDSVDAMLSMYEHVEAFLLKRLGVASIPKINGVAALKSYFARLECASWWRRQLRRMVARAYELGCFELGMVGAKAGSWYCSDRAVVRRRQQNKANALMMAATSIRNAVGQVMTLADIAKKSVSNKAIRRGELMTRIRGCEEWANANGLVGIFTTMTLPSRFHSQKHGGGKNRKYKGASPSDGQAWLCKQWAQLRAQLARDGIRLVGFRVAEPHHDGCPHWHMMLWCLPKHRFKVEAMILRYWLIEPELGAVKNRVKIIPMIAGMAAGYIAKYIAKNIDDISTATHTDDQAGAAAYTGVDLLGDIPVKPSDRVEAWASLWHIRQFQAIGQPSVTVWRELRRVDAKAAAGASDAFIHAYMAVHRDGAKRADWRGYMQAQGGAMLPRKDYALCIHTVDKVKRGRYGVVKAAWACGVREKIDVAAVPTKRLPWVKDGVASASAFRGFSHTWTRLNNCTPLTKKRVDEMTESAYQTNFWSTDARPCVINDLGRRVNRPPLGKNAAEWAAHHENSALTD